MIVVLSFGVGWFSITLGFGVTVGKFITAGHTTPTPSAPPSPGCGQTAVAGRVPPAPSRPAVTPSHPSLRSAWTEADGDICESMGIQRPK